MKTAHLRAVGPVLVAVSMALVAGLYAGSAHAESWELKTSVGGVKVFAKALDGSGIEMLKGTMDVPWTPKEVADVIFDVDAQRVYLVGMKNCRSWVRRRPNLGRRSARSTSAPPTLASTIARSF
jgi:hypothetical protein